MDLREQLIIIKQQLGVAFALIDDAIARIDAQPEPEPQPTLPWEGFETMGQPSDGE